jgi:hypothetical protein
VNSEDLFSTLCDISTQALSAPSVAHRLQASCADQPEFLNRDFDELAMDDVRFPHRPKHEHDIIPRKVLRYASQEHPRLPRLSLGRTQFSYRDLLRFRAIASLRLEYPAVDARHCGSIVSQQALTKKAKRAIPPCPLGKPAQVEPAEGPPASFKEKTLDKLRPTR